MNDYHINIFYSREDDGYIADIPDLVACSAFGPTPAAAVAELELAKAAWLAVAQESGQPLPLPRYRPIIYQTGPAMPIRCHSAFLNSYTPEDEGLYDELPTR
jgi:predicted RNase H-like HicB family nuclease